MKLAIWPPIVAVVCLVLIWGHLTAHPAAQGDPRALRWQLHLASGGPFLLDTGTGELWTVATDPKTASLVLLPIPKERPR